MYPLLFPLDRHNIFHNYNLIHSMTPISHYFPILRLMLGDNPVPPAPYMLSDDQCAQIIEAGLMFSGVSCLTIVEDGGVKKFSPAPPNVDTVAYILAHAHRVFLGGQNAVSYQTRAISVREDAASIEGMRRANDYMIADIDARGMVCAVQNEANYGLAALVKDYVTSTYQLVGCDICCP